MSSKDERQVRHYPPCWATFDKEKEKGVELKELVGEPERYVLGPATGC